MLWYIRPPQMQILKQSSAVFLQNSSFLAHSSWAIIRLNASIDSPSLPNSELIANKLILEIVKLFVYFWCRFVTLMWVGGCCLFSVVVLCGGHLNFWSLN